MVYWEASGWAATELGLRQFKKETNATVNIVYTDTHGTLAKTGALVNSYPSQSRPPCMLIGVPARAKQTREAGKYAALQNLVFIPANDPSGEMIFDRTTYGSTLNFAGGNGGIGVLHPHMFAYASKMGWRRMALLLPFEASDVSGRYVAAAAAVGVHPFLFFIKTLNDEIAKTQISEAFLQIKAKRISIIGVGVPSLTGELRNFFYTTAIQQELTKKGMQWIFSTTGSSENPLDLIRAREQNPIGRAFLHTRNLADNVEPKYDEPEKWGGPATDASFWSTYMEVVRNATMLNMMSSPPYNGAMTQMDVNCSRGSSQSSSPRCSKIPLRLNSDAERTAFALQVYGSFVTARGASYLLDEIHRAGLCAKVGDRSIEVSDVFEKLAESAIRGGRLTSSASMGGYVDYACTTADGRVIATNLSRCTTNLIKRASAKITIMGFGYPTVGPLATLGLQGWQRATDYISRSLKVYEMDVWTGMHPATVALVADGGAPIPWMGNSTEAPVDFVKDTCGSRYIVNSTSMDAECVHCPPGRGNPLNGSNLCSILMDEDCPAGQVWMAEAQRCESCEEGHYKTFRSVQVEPAGAMNVVAVCEACSPGTSASESGAVSCTACAPGSVAERSAQIYCEQCRIGTYQSMAGKSTCISCQDVLPGSSSLRGSSAQNECACPSGTFLKKSSSSKAVCAPCQEGLQCSGGTSPPTQKAGYWSAPSDNDLQAYSVVRCRNDWECPPGPIGSCPPNRDGIACNNCNDGFYPTSTSSYSSASDGSCEKCTALDVIPLIVLCVILVLLAVALVTAAPDPSTQQLTTVTAVATASQLIVAVQALQAIRRLQVRWPEPLASLLAAVSLLSLDLDFVKAACILGSDDPLTKFVCQLLAFPSAAAALATLFGLAKVLKRRVALDDLFNACGLVLSSMYISLTLMVMVPMQCVPNPNGTQAVLLHPGVMCWESTKHQAMIVLSILGFFAYPVAMLVWTTWITVQFPSLIKSGKGLRLVRRYRFLFGRFKPECYYFAVMLLLRNAVVALLPVALVNLISAQFISMAGTLLFGTVVQLRSWPWRTTLANVLDVYCSCCLLLLLVGAGSLADVDYDEHVSTLAGLLFFVVVSLPLLGVVFLVYSLAGRFCRRKTYAVFLCHHKAGAGALARQCKLMLSKNMHGKIFLDSDQLEELELIFDTVRADSAALVVLLTPEVQKRMWCAGEMVTAYRNGIPIVPVVCDGYESMSDSQMNQLSLIWTEQQISTLAFYGITTDMVAETYRYMKSLPVVTLSRNSSAQEQEAALLKVAAAAAMTKKFFVNSLGLDSPSSPARASAVETARPRILIAGGVGDTEIMATCITMSMLFQELLQTEVAVVRDFEGGAWGPEWQSAQYLVVVLSRRLLQDVSFAKLLLALMGDDEEQAPRVEFVTVNADTGFEFPAGEFFDKVAKHGMRAIDRSSSTKFTLEKQKGGDDENDEDDESEYDPEEGPQLAKAYRLLFNILALPLSPLGSEGLIRLQISEIARRFRNLD